MVEKVLSSEKAALSAAADLVGGQTNLAKSLSDTLGRPVTQQWIWNVINRDQPVPAEWCIPIERVTEGKIARRDLRPDLYPLEEGRAA